MSKGTFIFYDIDLVSIQYLTDEQAGRLIKAISYSRIQGKEPDFSDDAALKILFYQISEHISINEKKYKEKCKKNSESAKKRWEKEKSKTAEKQCDGIGSYTNECLYDTDTDTDTVSISATREIGGFYQKMSVAEIERLLVENSTEEIVYKDGALTNYTTGEIIHLDKQSIADYEEFLSNWD